MNDFISWQQNITLLIGGTRNSVLPDYYIWRLSTIGAGIYNPIWHFIVDNSCPGMRSVKPGRRAWDR